MRRFGILLGLRNALKRCTGDPLAVSAAHQSAPTFARE